jgi:spectrin alpha
VGHDLSTVQRLQRKHEGLERDLAALNDKVKDLDDTANRLMNTHPEQAQSIYEHQKDINERWNALTQKVWEQEHKFHNVSFLFL